LFNGNVAQTFTNFNVNGTLGNLVTIGSTTGANATLYRSTPSWNVGTHSVNGLANIGLSFTSGSNDYLSISAITGTNTTPPGPGVYMTGIVGSGGFTITV
jgi:hypothetical protein